jgi:hypothetical protein
MPVAVFRGDRCRQPMPYGLAGLSFPLVATMIAAIAAAPPRAGSRRLLPRLGVVADDLFVLVDTSSSRSLGRPPVRLVSRTSSSLSFGPFRRRSFGFATGSVAGVGFTTRLVSIGVFVFILGRPVRADSGASIGAIGASAAGAPVAGGLATRVEISLTFTFGPLRRAAVEASTGAASASVTCPALLTGCA